MVSGAQLVVSAAVVLVMRVFQPSVMGPMDKTKVLPFALYTAMFAAGLFANMKALMLTNVGAVIAARSCLPVIVCTHRVGLHGTIPPRRAIRRCPSPASSGSRVCTSQIHRRRTSTGLEGYAWLFAWWIPLALQMTYGKWMTEKIEMTQWERVFYTNAFAVSDDDRAVWARASTRKVADLGRSPPRSCPCWTWLAPSCVHGRGHLLQRLARRSVITATTFTLVGVLNKMATIAFTVAIVWPNDSVLRESGGGARVCILFGLLYQDAPKRGDKATGGGSRGEKTLGLRDGTRLAGLKTERGREREEGRGRGRERERRIGFGFRTAHARARESTRATKSGNPTRRASRRLPERSRNVSREDILLYKFISSSSRVSLLRDELSSP